MNVVSIADAGAGIDGRVILRVIPPVIECLGYGIIHHQARVAADPVFLFGLIPGYSVKNPFIGERNGFITRAKLVQLFVITVQLSITDMQEHFSAFAFKVVLRGVYLLFFLGKERYFMKPHGTGVKVSRLVVFPYQPQPVFGVAEDNLDVIGGNGLRITLVVMEGNKGIAVVALQAA